MRYRDVVGTLRESYDNGADERNASVKAHRKIEERAAFHDRLREQGTERLPDYPAPAAPRRPNNVRDRRVVRF